MNLVAAMPLGKCDASYAYCTASNFKKMISYMNDNPYLTFLPQVRVMGWNSTKSVDHRIIDCPTAGALWNRLLKALGLCW